MSKNKIFKLASIMLDKAQQRIADDQDEFPELEKEIMDMFNENDRMELVKWMNVEEMTIHYMSNFLLDSFLAEKLFEISKEKE